MVKKSKTDQHQADRQKRRRAEQKELRNVMFPETFVASDNSLEAFKRLVAEKILIAISTNVSVQEFILLPRSSAASGFPARRAARDEEHKDADSRIRFSLGEAALRHLPHPKTAT